MIGRTPWLLAAFAAIALVVAAAASGSATTGSGTIAGAPQIPLNGNVQGDFGYSTITLESGGCCDDAILGQFYKVNLLAGDHVTVHILSAGNDAPCAVFYKPGTDDYNFQYENDINEHDSSAKDNFNTNHGLEQFIAGASGTWVVMLSNYGPDCQRDSVEWAYSFVITAPHAMHLALAPGRTLTTGVNHLNVTVRDALNNAVTDPNLTIGLAWQWPGTPAKQIARVHVKNGVASFTFKIPTSRAGQKVKLITGAGDNISWVATSTGRNYTVH